MNGITPAMSPQRAAEIAATLDLRQLPPDFLANPYPVYARLRETEPVRRMPDGTYFLTRHADLVAVYRDAQRFSSDKQLEFGPKYNLTPFNQPPWAVAPGVSPLFQHHTSSLVFNDPPLHTRVRRIIMGALTRRAIEGMAPGLVRLVDNLLDAIEARGGGDLIDDFASAIPVEIIGNLLDVPHADRGPLRGWSLAILGALEPSLTPTQQALGHQSVKEFLAYLKDLVAERRKRPGNPESDVLTRLIQGDGGQALTEVELLQNCVFLLNAGHETTTNLIGNALICLQEWPDQHARLMADLSTPPSQPVGHLASVQGRDALLDLAIDEFLRFESSNQLGNRKAQADCEIGGVPLPKGALLTLCIGAANRDPAQYAEPERLDLRRAGNKHLAFGFGPHQCAGLSLARLEGRIAIGRFVQRFPHYSLSAPPVRGMRARFRGFLNAPFTIC